MSTPDPALTDVTHTALETVPPLPAALKSLAYLVVLPVQFVSFWVAALLPLAYLPLLATGVAEAHLSAFVALLGVNVLAFVLGHSYKQPA